MGDHIGLRCTKCTLGVNLKECTYYIFVTFPAFFRAELIHRWSLFTGGACSKVIKNIIYFAFNNICTLEFKTQPTVTFFIDIYSRPLRKQRCLAQRGQNMFARCDQWILIHFVGFCIFSVQSLHAIESHSKKNNSSFSERGKRTILLFMHVNQVSQLV